MFRKLLHSIALAAITSTAMTASAEAAPKLKIDNDTFDFGFTPEGLPVVHKYWAYNVGDETLRITHIRPSCGCTSVPLTKHYIEPGDSVGMELKFDTKRFKGQVTKTAAVVTNDLTQSDAKLHFTARVGKWEGVILTTPSQVYLDTLGKTEQIVTIKNTSAETYTVSIASPIAPHMDFALSSTSLPAKGEIKMSIRPTPQTPIGEYNTSVTLHLDGPEPHNVTVPVYGTGYVH